MRFKLCESYFYADMQVLLINIFLNVKAYLSYKLQFKLHNKISRNYFLYIFLNINIY